MQESRQEVTKVVSHVKDGGKSTCVSIHQTISGLLN